MLIFTSAHFCKHLPYCFHKCAAYMKYTQDVRHGKEPKCANVSFSQVSNLNQKLRRQTQPLILSIWKYVLYIFCFTCFL